jgi:hypothetical protein
MGYMFYYATDFDKEVTGWNVCKVDNFVGMFSDSGQSSTTLEPPENGECIDCPSGTTSGSGEYVQGQNPCCLNDSGFRIALALWFSDPTLAESTYGNIKDW